MEATKCKSCGAPIVFITTLKNKQMPCNAETIHFLADITCRDSYITMSGLTVRGKIVPPDTPNAVVGYVPHWATCNNPDAFHAKEPPQPRDSNPPPAPNKPKYTLFQRLQLLMKERRPVIYPDARSHEDIEYAYISGVISRYNDNTGKFETTVELFDRCGNSVTVVTPDKIKLKE